MPIFHGCKDEQTARNRAANASTGEYLGFDERVKLYVYQTDAGRVLELHQRGWIGDSFYTVYSATVYVPSQSWEPVKPGTFASVDYHNDRDENEHSWAVVDATDNIKAMHKALLEDAARRRFERLELEEIMRPAVGKRLEVVKGRKVARGTVGMCIWIGAQRYGTRVGIKDASGNVHWTSASNVQVV